jgi:ABC-2 type transport system permease protein
MSLCVPFLLAFMWFYRDVLRGVSFNWSISFWLALILGHLLSFTTVMMLGFIALFVEEAMALFELYYFPMLFLSGQVVPVAMLPAWAQTLAKYLPFYYTTNLPVDIGIGRVTGQGVWTGMLVQVTYIAVAFGVSKILWAKGLKQFSGVGL